MCDICKMNHGTRVNFLKGGLCKECGTRNRLPFAIYTHDSVDDAEKYWHHFTFEGVARCSACGHSACDSALLCRDLNTLSAELAKPEAAFA